MSRTIRNIPHDKWFRRPKTHAYRRDLIACEEEIRSELGPNYLAGHFAKIGTIPTNRDDIYIKARFEDQPKEFLYNDLYRIHILGQTKNQKACDLDHSIEFDKQKNVFRAWRGYLSKQRKVNYVPFMVTIAKKQYPVRIDINWWYD